jgi:hypothetical protein
MKKLIHSTPGKGLTPCSPALSLSKLTIIFLLVASFQYSYSQTCGCSNPSVPQVGSGAGVSTISQAIASGKFLPLTQAQTTSQMVCVKGEFTINQQYAFYDSDVFMDADAVITVASSDGLKIFQNTTIKGCTVAWNFIEVLTGAKFETFDSEI